MKTIVWDNVELTYDETIKVGDLISTYHKGYHRVVEIQSREDDEDALSPLFVYLQEFRSDGTSIKKNKMESCDASYCRKAKEILQEEIKKHKDIVKKLKLIDTSRKVNNE